MTRLVPWSATGVLASLLFAMPARAADEAAPLPSHDIRGSATLGGAVDIGALPRPSPGVALGFDVRRGALGAHLAASAFLGQHDRASGTSLALFDALASICALAPVGSRLDVGACGGLGAGLLRAELDATSAVSTRLRPEGLATSRVDVALTPVLYLSLEAGVVLDPLRTVSPLPSSPSQEAHRTSLFSFRGAVSLQVRLW